MNTHTRFLALALCGAGLGGAAWAEAPDPITFSLGSTIQYDSNLFRLPDGANTQALLGRDSAAELITITHLGVRLDKRYSLQRFELGLGVTDYRFANFSRLDFLASNFDAAWRWHLTPRLSGNLTTERTVTFNSFADAQGVNQANQRMIRRQRLDADYHVDDGWHLLAGATRLTQLNVLQQVEEDDTRIEAFEAGVRYDFSSGSTMGWRVRVADGQYYRRTGPFLNGRIGNSFEQLSNELRLHWAWSAKTSFDLVADFIDREHLNAPERDFSAVNARANLVWKASAKTSLHVDLSRDNAGYQTASTNYVRTDRLSVAPVWQATPRTSVRLRHSVARRSFLGGPGGPPTGQRRDTTRDNSIAVNWVAREGVSLTASLEQSRRVSNMPGLDFTSNRFLIGARISF